MSSNIRPDDHRKKWDRDKYEKLAKERFSKKDQKLRENPDSPVKRELLKARDFKVDLTSKIGKSQIITKTSENKSLGGFFCEICECLVKDSVSFFDHINGKNHQRNLGMSMKVERSTLDQVKKRIEMFNQKSDKGEKNIKPISQKNRVDELEEEEEREEKQKACKNKKKAKKREAAFDEEEKDDDFSNLMGFSSFSSKKLK